MPSEIQRLSFGELLNMKIEEKGIAKSELAGTLGVTNASITRMLKDEHSVSVDKALAVLDELGLCLVVVEKDDDISGRAYKLAPSKRDTALVKKASTAK